MSPGPRWNVSNRLLAFASFWVLLLAMAGHSGAQTLPVSFVARIDSPLPALTRGLIATADFNSDGKLDVVTSGNTNIWVLLGNGDGTFQPAVAYSTAGGPTSLMLGDFNGDGKPDILVVNDYSTSVSVFLNNGDGTFQAQVVTGLTTNEQGTVAVGDFNGDGKADIAVPVTVAESGNSAVSILLGNGDGTFQSPIISTGYAPTPLEIQVADFNGDGKLDVVWGGRFSPSWVVFLGNGNGTVQPPLKTPAQGDLGAVADFNNDGIPDLVDLEGTVFLGKGDGTFGTGLASPNCRDCTALLVGDFNGDGSLDIVGYGSGETTVILLGKGDGIFQRPVSFNYPEYTLAAGDFNGDGRLDLIGMPANTYNYNEDVLSVALGKGDGSFLLDTFTNTRCSGCDTISNGSILIADLNGDGKPDLVDVQPERGQSRVVTLLGNGNGTFRKTDDIILQGTLTLQSNAAVGDFNHDGKLDLAVVDTGYVGVLLGNGDGTFKTEVQYGDGTAAYVAVGDFNGDGNLDIVTNDFVLLGNGDGTFGFAKSFPSIGTFIVVADFNHDGKLDVAGNSAVILGNGDGTFGPPINYPAGGGGGYIAVGDFNHDSNLDIVGSTSSNQVDVMLGNGDGTFGTPKTFAVGHAPGSVAVSDFNGDGKLDIAVFNTFWSDVSVLLGNGDGTFLPAAYFASAGGHLGSIAVADLNGDGSPDIAVEGAYLLFNRPQGADASLSPNSLNFGNQDIGTASTPLKTTLFNLGQTGLTINSISIVGPQAGDFSETNTCGGSVAAGAECVISVTFKPTATGIRNASLSVTDNGIGSPHTVGISGGGAGLGLGIASGGSSSATVSAGQTANYKLTIGGAGFSGTAALSCTGAPTGAACMVPASVSVSATTSSPVSVSVTTTARTMSALAPSGLRPSPWLWAMGVLGLVTLPGWFHRPRVRRWRRSLPLLLLLLICSCGGGTSSSGQGGTPAGTYDLTVTATSGSLAQHVSLKLIVQ
jgi:hypothetical protein